MFRILFVLIVLALSIAAPIAYSQNASTAHQSVLDVNSMDPSVDPCTDFFTYSCGGWLKKNPIPADKTSWGLSSKLADDNRVLLREIL
jgi:putative endopeptidase